MTILALELISMHAQHTSIETEVWWFSTISASSMLLLMASSSSINDAEPDTCDCSWDSISKCKNDIVETYVLYVKILEGCDLVLELLLVGAGQNSLNACLL